MTDRREEILNSEHTKFIVEKGIQSIYPKKFPAAYATAAINAMDSYMEVTVLEAFDYVAKHVQNTMITDAGVSMFLVDDNWIEKEELFKNFL